jgi:uncharacterized protein
MKKNNFNPIVIVSKNSAFPGSNHSDCQCDCDTGDCACTVAPTTIIVDKSILLGEGTYQRQNTSSYQKLNGEFSIWFSPDHNPVVTNSDADKVLFLFNGARTVSSALVSMPKDKHEVACKVAIEFIKAGLLVQENQITTFDSTHQTLTSWLHITDRCNLRCSYCYLPHVREDMSLETGMAAIDATFRSAEIHQFKKVKFKYAGGEPLIRYETVLALHKYALNEGQRLGINVEGVLLSNGTLLTEEKAEEIHNLGMRLMISLDGLGHSHDAQRPYAGGHESFADVERGINIALGAGITPNISITVSSKNADKLAELVDWVLEHDLPFSLNFYRENELSMVDKDLSFIDQKIIDGMKKAYKAIEERLPEKSLLASIVDRANLSSPHQMTCGVGNNYMVFDCNGQVGKCQMLMKNVITNLTVLDPLGEIQKDKRGIQNLSVEEKEGCKTCEWKYWCTGGCSLNTFRATGRYDVKSPNCHIYKALYPEAMRLEGLRLLKYEYPQ